MNQEATDAVIDKIIQRKQNVASTPLERIVLAFCNRAAEAYDIWLDGSFDKFKIALNEVKKQIIRDIKRRKVEKIDFDTIKKCIKLSALRQTDSDFVKNIAKFLMSLSSNNIK